MKWHGGNDEIQDARQIFSYEVLILSHRRRCVPLFNPDIIVVAPLAMCLAYRCPEQCYCGAATEDYSRLGTSDGCNMMCTGFPNEMCGGNLAINVRLRCGALARRVPKERVAS